METSCWFRDIPFWAAKNAFSKIKALQESERDNFALFDKGGYFFILKDNYIIHKLGRCNSSREIAIDFSNALLEYLHSSKKRNKYILRYACGFNE